MPSDRGRRFNWYSRYWHDWPDVQKRVHEVAKAHARYLGYEVHMVGGFGPPRDVGPVMRLTVLVYRRSGKDRSPEYEHLIVDVERRAGKFHVKTATVRNLD